MTQVTIDLSASGEDIVLSFGSHSVRVRCPGNAIFFAEGARKSLSTILARTERSEGAATAEELERIRDNVRVAERALVGVSLIEAVLSTRRTSPEAKLNTVGVPTQALVDAFLRKGGKVEDEGERAARKLEEKYGINLEDFGDLA